MIGAGPAGSTAAALLAERGHRVALFERSAFPRFHIGESLLPAANPVLESLGLRDRLRAEGTVVKRGASFRHEDGEHESSVLFEESLQGAEPTTFQVVRSRFDELLLEAAAARGARIFQPSHVREVSRDANGATVVAASEEGEHQECRCRFVVDASGQAGLLAKRLDLRLFEPELRNVAVHAHFTGVQWDPAVRRGDIQVVSRSDLGWVWMIPLGEQIVSVGLVLPRERALRGAGHELKAAFLNELWSSTVVRSQLGAARIARAVRRDADYSYGVRRYAGRRWLLAGDAGSFLDPVFSTGVTIALESGAEAAEAVSRSLRGASRRRALARYEARQRQRYEYFGRFVKSFYRPGFRDLLCQRNDALAIPAALTSVLAGNSRPRWSVRWRLEAFYRMSKAQEAIGLVERLHRAPETPKVSGLRRESSESESAVV